MGNTVVSSTKIRELVRLGEVSRANSMLGRSHSITGKVVKGSRRGKKIGFPTANIKPNTELVPGGGIYAVYFNHAGKRYKGVANLGHNPTFGAGEFSVEVHVMGFSMNIYGKDVKVEFVERLRDEKKFKGVEELKKAIARDIARAEKILS
jgi:riboflavin kinase/FMN adenylyltransferase